jgi:hypothetical protein
MAKVIKKETIWRVIGAVLAGYAAIGALIVVTDWIFGFFIPELRSSREPPGYYFAASIMTDSIYSVIGGYLCAKVARTAVRNATLGLMVFGELMGVVSTVMLWYTVPHPYSFALLVLYPPLVWLGSWLRLRKVPVKPVLVRV